MAKKLAKRARGRRPDYRLQTPVAMDLDAPFGKYKIDSFVSELASQSQHDNPFVGDASAKWLRSWVNTIGNIAVEDARKVFDAPRVTASGKRFLADFEQIKQAARSAASIPANVVAAALVHSHARGIKSGVGELESLVEMLQGEASKWGDRSDALLGGIKKAKPRKSESDPQLNRYIEKMAVVWAIVCNRPVGRSGEGPFVRFLAAGWKDLQLRAPAGRDGRPLPLEDWIGERLKSQLRKGKWLADFSRQRP